MLLAGTATAVGFAFDAGSGDRQLSGVFSACYAIGCVLAVLAVRQNSVFTAVIQPPLILFASVPGAYFLFHGGQIGGLKDLAINCGYPLIERFPLMFFTAATVLLIGMVRWYVGMSARRGAPAETTPAAETRSARTSAASAGLLTAVGAKVSGFFGRVADAEDDAEEDRPRRRAADRPRRGARTSAGEAALSAREARGARKPVRKTTPSRSRHTRPPDTELIEPVTERPRRSRTARQEPPAAEPRRRARTQPPRDAREPRRQPPPERRSRYDGYERPERRERPQRSERPQRRPRYEDFAADYGTEYEPLEPRSTNGGSTHHPVSRVRYRGGDDEDHRTEYRTRPRRRHSREPWDYDG